MWIDKRQIALFLPAPCCLSAAGLEFEQAGTPFSDHRMGAGCSPDWVSIQYGYTSNGNISWHTAIDFRWFGPAAILNADDLR